MDALHEFYDEYKEYAIQKVVNQVKNNFYTYMNKDDEDENDENNEDENDENEDIDINKLEFIRIHDQFEEPIGLFRYEDTILFCDLDDEFKWSQINKEILNIKNPTNDIARLLDNSSDKIEYELYTLDCVEKWFIDDLINSKQDVRNLIETEDTDYQVKWFDDFEVKLEEGGENTHKYIITKNGEFFSGFEDIDTSFQPGDEIRIMIHKKNNNLIIENWGDGWGDLASLIIIKYKG